MDYDKGCALLLTALSGFHGRFKKMFGQAALRLDDNSYLITESNVQLSTVTEDDLGVCDISYGEIGEIFRRLRDVNAIMVGCSQDTVKVSLREEDIPVTLEDLAHLTGPRLQVIPDLSPDTIVRALADTSVCLVKGVGVISAASNPRKAVAGLHIVEKACEAEVHGEMLGGTIPLDQTDAVACRSSFRSDYVNRNESSEVAYMGFDEKEFACRSQLIDYGKKLVEQDLAYGSWGNLSVRLSEREMLITPSSMDYFDIKPEDIVKVSIDTLEYGNQRIPSSSCNLHAALYREIPDCNAVIHTHSNGLSVFAACNAGFAINDPDMRQLIGDILVAGTYDPDASENVDSVVDTMRNTHAAIIPHHGGLFTGPSLEIVFAIAEAVELRARTILNFDTRTDAGNE